MTDLPAYYRYSEISARPPKWPFDLRGCLRSWGRSCLNAAGMISSVGSKGKIGREDGCIGRVTRRGGGNAKKKEPQRGAVMTSAAQTEARKPILIPK